MPRSPGRPRSTGRLVTIRLADDTVGRAEILAAAVPLTTLARILARAAELGLAEVERELADAVSKGPKNGVGVRADVGTGEAA